jgi:hypothetical protein
MNAILGAALLTVAAGCSSMANGPMEAVKPFSDAPRAGNVYLLRGWIGIFSTGIDRLGEKVNEAGVHGQVYQQGQWHELADTIAAKYKNARDPEPLVLVGHSYGADDIVNIARELEKENVTVDLLVTIDPTTPPAVPKNVKHAYNLYQPNLLDAMPVLRGVALRPEDGFKGKLENVNIREDRRDLLEDGTNHFNIEKKDKIHQETIKQILAICPPRSQWAANRRNSPINASYNQTPAPTKATTP